MTSFMQGSLLQISKFNQRKESLPPAIGLISRELWGNQARRNCDFMRMAAN